MYERAHASARSREKRHDDSGVPARRLSDRLRRQLGAQRHGDRRHDAPHGQQGLAETKLEPQDVEVAHIGNFAAELFCNQGHLGGLFAAAIRSSRVFRVAARRRVRVGKPRDAGLRPISKQAATGSRQWSASSRCAMCPASRPRNTSAGLRCGRATSTRKRASRGRACSAMSLTKYDRRFGLKQEHLAHR